MPFVQISCDSRQLRQLRNDGEQPVFRLDEDSLSLSDVVDSLWGKTGAEPRKVLSSSPSRDRSAQDGVKLTALRA